MAPIIQVESLVKKFGELPAVNGISFSVESGAIFGFLGPNGAGKSTTIKMLATLLKPTSGKATLAGFDINSQSNQVRQSIGLVFQDPSLDIRLTADENLQFHAMLYNVPKDVFAARCEQVLRMVDLLDRRSSPVSTFSGGMKRRLEIARGLLHHPKVLFLDEPTLGLDPQTRNAIWHHVRKLRDEVFGGGEFCRWVGCELDRGERVSFSLCLNGLDQKHTTAQSDAQCHCAFLAK